MQPQQDWYQHQVPEEERLNAQEVLTAWERVALSHSGGSFVIYAKPRNDIDIAYCKHRIELIWFRMN